MNLLNNINALNFIWPWVFILLPLPLIVRRFFKPVSQGVQGALKVPFFNRLSGNIQNEGNGNHTVWWRWLLLSLIWGLLVTALARPSWVGKEIPLPVKGRDVMLAIDLSGSMDERDLAGGRLNRLAVVKAAADEFISRRVGDRIGLILFSDRAYLQSPLTFDRKVVRELLQEAQVGLTGQQTAIGDAIAIALKRLKELPSDGKKDNRVLILLTDGANTAGVMQPMTAALLAKKIGIRVYTIGVGSKGRNIFGRGTDLDEATLTAIAKTTNGQYFRATDAKTLDNIYREIDKLVPSFGKPIHLRPEISWFHWPAGLALVLSGMLVGFILLSKLTRKSS
ncbi:MAG: vWA domain-containing protein [Ostreibacterium sp.]